MTYALLSESKEVTIRRESREKIAISTLEPLTDDQMRDLYWVVLLMAKTKLRLKDIFTDQEAKELTIDEFREWKKERNRDPICMLWKGDCSPIWIFSPNDVHEPALLMGEIKLFSKKPTREQCKTIWKEKEQ